MRHKVGLKVTSDQNEEYPDLFLPVAENYRISNHFCGYSNGLSADNNPMVLVKLKSLSTGTDIYICSRIELMVLCMVNLVWDTKLYPKRPQ